MSTPFSKGTQVFPKTQARGDKEAEMKNLDGNENENDDVRDTKIENVQKLSHDTNSENLASHQPVTLSANQLRDLKRLSCQIASILKIMAASSSSGHQWVPDIRAALARTQALITSQDAAGFSAEEIIEPILQATWMKDYLAEMNRGIELSADSEEDLASTENDSPEQRTVLTTTQISLTASQNTSGKDSQDENGNTPQEDEFS